MTYAHEHAGQEPHIVVNMPRIEHLREPFGIGCARPRISWKATSTDPALRQAAYELETTDRDRGSSFTSGRVESDQSVLVPWPGPPLKSRSRCGVRVRIWVSGNPTPSPWSAQEVLETGLLDPDDWSAEFVTPDWDEDTSTDQPPPLLRKEFDVPAGVTGARLYVTALGVYEIELNGERVGDLALAPGWTSYPRRLRYQTYDITDLLVKGTNAVGAWLGDGWYRGRLGFLGGTRNIYGDRLGLLAQIELLFPDGTLQRIVTDTSWRAMHGPVRLSSLYDGEAYDAGRELPGWSSAGFDDAGWSKARIIEWNKNSLVAPLGPPVRCTEELAPYEILTSPSGKTIVDFGQNIVGRVSIEVEGDEGGSVRLRHAEVLQRGELYTRPLRHAKATDEYILGTEGWGCWEPRFTFHGFRYLEVNESSGVRADLNKIKARVYHTDMERTGWFSSSHELLNRFHDNVVWSMRGNFLDIPTDCPQRDERLGWTGDIQVFAPTAAFLYDCAGFLASWLRDVEAEQLPDGTVPLFVPTVPSKRWASPTPVAVWGDVAVLTPWVLYERFGDLGLVEGQYASAKAWVDRVASAASEDRLWNDGFQLGDWLDPAAPPDDPAAARADGHLVATAYFAESAKVLSYMAMALKRDDDADQYTKLAAHAARAFVRRWVRSNGLLENEAQTSYALAIQFDLIPGKATRLAAGRRLAELVRAEGHRIGTGFAGTPLICDALCSVGHYDTAYTLLLQQECPSWLYPVTQGATTTWERWDSLLPDGTVNPGQMTSFNHYALGAVADWLHRTVAGLAPAEPGYRRLLVRPRPGGGLTHASAAHETPYGRAEVRWHRDNDELEVDVLVPPGTTATIDLPGGQPPFSVSAGRHRIALGDSARIRTTTMESRKP